ncbi:SMP-30/gluconolactonase/LRE family protein [Flavobacteriaceae bacterium TP-CH-4]|uniref:SMP-30/gluconolactonase/LRE family protein n=1 Tax=Pelagihabitans pacificus TaxID=2696054 RepID=A0A967AWL6_9FLAO|nr:SMP-30/gluconolactonase/LRE family protein [Pelagihabitans pacificus]NHF61254.1 SMP-30/gluconolactonase/LRE family protein [Pelagihabitans pacificus]
MKTSLALLLLLTTFISCEAQNPGIIAKGAQLTLVADGYDFTEGPAVAANGDVYFTDQPNDRIVKWNAADNSVTDWMKPSGRSNGLYFDHMGNLLSCADEKNELWQIDPEKKVTVLVDNFEGKCLGGPNDLWVDPKGGIYFTDPLYERPWWNHTEPQIPERRVYYISPDKRELTIVAEGFVMPNGIIGSADGKTLYIADIKDGKTYVYAVNEDGSLSDRTLFCELGSDGMTLDNQGNVYLTGDGVTVFDKNGKQIHHIQVPEKWTANVTFGGLDQKTLFITAMDSVYTLAMNVHGVR